MNVLGNLGDPDKLAAALKPLVDSAVDKGAAELHASVTVAITSLEQEINTSRDLLLAELQAWRFMVAPVLAKTTAAITETEDTVAKMGALLDRISGKA